MDFLKYKSKAQPWMHLITLPLLWLPLPFLIICDLLCALYQLVCFPIYKIKWVPRAEYILIMDRNKLDYLKGFEKLGCMYCGYANGVLRYMKEVAGLTEKYWCGIMHEGKPGFKPQEDQIVNNFARFNDEKDFHDKYGK